MDFKDKVVFLTGANRGIGKSLLKELLGKGVRKIYATSRSLENMENFNDERVVPIELDITNDSQVLKAVEQAQDTQVLINNAGKIEYGGILDSDSEKIFSDMNTNYFGTLNVMKAFVPVLEKNTPASIVNIVSIAAYSSFPFIAGYSASKAALYSATQAVRIELLKRGVSVFAINPGAIDTDMNKGYEGEMTSSEDVAQSIIHELTGADFDIIPDKVGREMYKVWRENPLNLEKMAASMFHGE